MPISYKYLGFKLFCYSQVNPKSKLVLNFIAAVFSFNNMGKGKGGKAQTQTNTTEKKSASANTKTTEPPKGGAKDTPQPKGGKKGGKK